MVGDLLENHGQAGANNVVGQKIHEAIKREDIGVNEMNGNHVTRLMVKFMKPFLEH